MALVCFIVTPPKTRRKQCDFFIVFASIRRSYVLSPFYVQFVLNRVRIVPPFVLCQYLFRKFGIMRITITFVFLKFLVVSQTNHPHLLDCYREQRNMCKKKPMRTHRLCCVMYMAERVGFEPTHASRRLVDFESTPLGLLGTFPLKITTRSIITQRTNACNPPETIPSFRRIRHVSTAFL